MKSQLNRLVLVACLLLSAATAVQAENKTTEVPGRLPPVGSPPPLLTLELLQAPAQAKADLDSLKGKVVVLEFWATWCGPCVAAIPHLNEMTEKLKGSDIQFISITDESREVVEKFLSKKPINTWIGLDKDKVVGTRYGIKTIPTTIIIDKNGKVAALSSPSELEADDLKEIVAGHPVPKILSLNSTIRELRDIVIAGRIMPGQPRTALYQVELVPQAIPSGLMRSHSEGNVEMRGATIADMLAEAYSTTKDRVIINTKLSDQKFDLVIKRPAKADPEKRNEALRLALRDTFDISPHMENQTQEVYKLEKSDKAGSALSKPSSSYGSSMKYDGSGIEALNFSMDALSHLLEEQFGKPVLNETKMSGGYDFNLPLKKDGTLLDLNPALEKLGLHLLPAKSTLQVLVVDAAGKKTTENK